MVNWTYIGNEFILNDDMDYIGFVYCIDNLISGKKYIGKKLFYFKKTKMVKGKKKRFKVQSDWQSYYGSNVELENDVAKYGTECFTREILHLCKSKGECSYLEAKEQFRKEVMESDEYYNSWIMVRVRKSHLKEYNDRISKNICKTTS